MQCNKQTVQLRLQHSAAHVDRCINHLAETLRGKENHLIQSTETRRDRMDPLIHPSLTHLAYDVMLVVFLVKGQDGWYKFGNLLLQFFAGHQVAHGAHGLSHSQPQLEEYNVILSCSYELQPL